MRVIALTFKTDNWGIIASMLCMIHCISTPFIFFAQSCSVSCCESGPNWWRVLDFIFLLISFFAIYQSSRTTSKLWVKYLMWTFWVSLLIVLLNENVQVFSLPTTAVYYPEIMLVAIHFYNLKYCQCKKDACCVK